MRLLPEPHVRVTNGTIRLEGTDLYSLSETDMKKLRGDRIGMIFQEPMTALNPQKTVGWQIDEVLRLHTKLGRKERRAAVLNMLAEVKIPDPESAYNAYPHQISGGQRQRVMIAMALILKPRLIIADEPTTALDVTTQAQILKLIRDLQREHDTGILFITHDFGVVAEIADRVAVLRLGELVEEGPANEVLNHPQHPYTKALIASVPALTPPEPKPSVDAQPIILKASALRKTFKARGGLLTGKRSAVPAVKDLSFELRQGETLGVVGESGSGKTTVSRIVTRLLEADSGKVDVNGKDFLSASPREVRAMRKDIQMVFQDPMASLNPRRRVVDLIAQGPQPTVFRMNFPAGSGSASASPARWRWSRASSSPTNRSPRSMSPYRLRCCGFWPTSANGSICRFFSSRMICASRPSFATASSSCRRVRSPKQV